MIRPCLLSKGGCGLAVLAIAGVILLCRARLLLFRCGLRRPKERFMIQSVSFETEWSFSLCGPIKIVVLANGEILVDGKPVEPLTKTREQLFSKTSPVAQEQS